MRNLSAFVSADWAKNPQKRSAYVADWNKRRIRASEPPGGAWTLDAVLALAKALSQDGPVLVGVDVVLGVPEGYWRSLPNERDQGPPETFIHWLERIDLAGGFFETVASRDDWRVDRPWFRVAKGAGGLTSFTSQVDGGMHRRIDRATGGNPVFAVSGIPGTVGSGSREFWKELIPLLSEDRGFAIWPFEGELNSLLANRGVVLCETYPGLAYAAALANELPTGRIANSKTNREWRDDVCARLAQAQWVRSNRIDLGPLGPLRANEDDFDAHFTAAAVLRCLVEERPLSHPNWIDAEAEGSMLLAGVVEPDRKSGSSKRTTEKSSRPIAGSRSRVGALPRRAASKGNRGHVYRCPIPGCGKVFVGSRGGWDAHVGSVRLHRAWRSGINVPEERKRLFRKEFGDWFE